MHTNITSDPIEEFLNDATRLLHDLPAQRRLQVVDEARDHITTRAKELTDSGKDSAAASILAVSSFGDVNHWSKAIVNAAFRSRWSGPARLVVYPLVAYLAAFPTIALQLRVNPPEDAIEFSLPLSLVLIFLASMLSREINLRPLARLSIAIVGVCFLDLCVMAFCYNRGATSDHARLAGFAREIPLIVGLSGFNLGLSAIGLMTHLAGVSFGRGLLWLRWRRKPVSA
jgi:hypothetical protein